ncbi:MAG: trypsin-like peptidase domain-containing protein, partial [Patescibacteria group bacterium]
DAEGSVIVDNSVLSVLGGLREVSITLFDGASLSASISSRDESTGIAFLKPATTTADGKIAHFTPATLSMDSPVLGQSVIVLSGKSIPRITDGLVTAIIPRTEGEDSIVDTNVPPDFIMGGSPLVSTEGVLLGISTSISRESSQNGFIPASMLAGKDKITKDASIGE